jgi:hypothetical protein
MTFIGPNPSRRADGRATFTSVSPEPIGRDEVALRPDPKPTEPREMDRRFNAFSGPTMLWRRCLHRWFLPRHPVARANVEPLHPRIMMDAAPVVGTNPAPLSYVEKRGPAKIDPDLTVSANTDTPLEAATVAVLGYQSGEDVLGVTVPKGLSPWWDPNRGVLTLTGAAPAASYQAALRSITYADLSANPNLSRRVAEFLVLDSQSVSRAADRTISIVATNDPPTLFTPPAQRVTDGATLTFGTASGNAIVVSDVDANGAAEQVTLTASHGQLTLAQTAELTFTLGAGAGDGTMTFTGTLKRIDAALDGLTFTADAGFNGDATLLVSIDDLGNTGLGGPQIVNGSVPIVVSGNPINTPTVSGDPSGGSIPTPPPPPPPIVGQTPPGGTSVPPLPEPMTGTAPLPVTLAAAPSAASHKPGDLPRPLPVEAKASNGSAPMQSSGGIAASDVGTNDADTPSQQKGLTVFYTPPPAHALGGAMPMGSDRSANPDWARQLTLASGRLESLVQTNQAGTNFEQKVGYFAFDSTEVRSPARPHVSFTLSTADDDREGPMFARNTGLWTELDALRRRATSDIPLRVWAGTASVITVGASVAWFLWMSRAGSLLSGLMSAMPAWRMVDPLPVLDHVGQTAVMLKRNADEEVETLLRT